ncbi:MAG: archease [Chloroflexi bacterium]|nr:archease [Chloroflexota bacterium]
MTTSDNPCGFIEIAHTADWAVKIWAPDFMSLLAEAARAMYALQMTRVEGQSGRAAVEMSVAGEDEESWLVGFLSELVYWQDTRGIMVEELAFSRDGSVIRARGWAVTIAERAKEIKAVTYSGLEVRVTEQGVEAVVVFDV